MKKWEDLKPDEQQAAIGKATGEILTAVVEGAIRFNDEANKDTMQAEIDAAIEKANDNRTPWFAGEYVYDAVGERLRSMGKCDAEDAYYPEPGESVIRL